MPRLSRVIPAFVVLVATLMVPMPVVAQMPTDLSQVVVIDAGSEPRRELRYAWTEEHTERFESVVTVDMAATEDGRPVLAMELPVSITVRAKVTTVAEDGRARIAMVFDELSFGPLSASGGGLPDSDAAAEAFANSIEAVTHLLSQVRAWQVMDARGTVLRSGMELPPGFPPDVEARLAQASNSVVLLPEEPVGVGARWESTGTTVSQGVSLGVTTTMELTAIDDDEITLALSMRLADGSDALPPTTNPFDTFELDGGGMYRLDLDGIFPRESRVGMTMIISGDIPNEAGQVMPVEMTVDLDMTSEALVLD